MTCSAWVASTTLARSPRVPSTGSARLSLAGARIGVRVDEPHRHQAEVGQLAQPAPEQHGHVAGADDQRALARAMVAARAEAQDVERGAPGGHEQGAEDELVQRDCRLDVLRVGRARRCLS